MKSIKLEHDVQNEIRTWCGEHNLLAFRANVGSGYTPDGRYFTTGLPKGFPDVIVLDNDGHTIFVECKTLIGKAREDQKRLHAELIKRKHVVLISHSLEEFIQQITKHINIEE